MTLATSILARFSRAFRRNAPDQPDMFDVRLQKLTSATSRQRKHTTGVFKNRHARLAA